MKQCKVGKFLGIIIMVLGFWTFSAAQDEILLLDEEAEETEENGCLPSIMETEYDKFAADSLSDLDIRQKYNFGSEHFKNKNYKAALPYLWTVFLQDTGQFGDQERRSRLAVTKIAQIYYEQQQMDSTLIICYRGLERFPDLIRLHYYAGFLQETLGKFRCAIPHYEAMVNSDSASYADLQASGEDAEKLEAIKTSYISNLKKLGFLYLKDENDTAIEIQQKVCDIDPSNADEANTLAQYSEYFYGAGAGLEHFETAYNNNPDDLTIAFRFGKAAVQGGQYGKAIEPLSKCIANKPDKQTLLLRANAYENLNQLSNSSADYKKVLEMDPDNADVMLNISLNYSALNNFESANYWIGRALQAKKDYGMAYIVRGELYELAVSYCQAQRGSEKYEDKLVYEKAYLQYELAQRDPGFISRAKTKQNNLKPFLPTTEDRFMHKNDKIENACYDFLK